ncbi:MAG: toll/interleukin-1 receptor domain-containing protein, partial [Lachnospiraceae bacterium]|nr:toll/interleukin-1 receptor domain-containing protein [Lachnospiraceae bacterium]
MSLENVRYDAFISYRHCELDSFISVNLHRKLESYRIPGAVAAKLPDGKKKIERVFRDEAELPLSGNLSDPITQALNNSEFLIVVCTSRLPESQWCRKEIETFVGLHGRDHVLL